MYCRPNKQILYSLKRTFDCPKNTPGNEYSSYSTVVNNFHINKKTKIITPQKQYTGYNNRMVRFQKLTRNFSHLTQAQRTPSAAATVQVSHALPAVLFSCLLRGQFPRWRRNRKRLSVCSVLRCPDL